MHKSVSLILTLALLTLFLLTACEQGAATPAATTPAPGATEQVGPDGAVIPSVAAATATPVPVEPVSGKALVIGRVLSAQSSEPLTNTIVMLAEVFRQGEAGAFVLDASRSPSTFTDGEGNFVIANVEPGEYVIAIGDPFQNSKIIQDPTTQKAATWQVVADQVLDVEDVLVD